MTTNKLFLFPVLAVIIMYVVFNAQPGKKAKIYTKAYPDYQAQQVKGNNITEKKEQQLFCNNQTSYPHQKVLSYSLFGKGTRWNKGGLKYRNSLRIIFNQMKNLDLYKDWIIRVYHDGGTNAIETERSFKADPQLQFCNVKNLNKTIPGIANQILGTFYRASVLADPNVDISCSRDLDSELTERETAAVGDWLNSSKAIHIMRDHVWHDLLLLGGTWCFRQHAYREQGKLIIKDIVEQAQTTTGTNDQHVLKKSFFRTFHALKDTIQHDSYNCKTFPGSIAWPTKRRNLYYFVGCSEIPCKKYGKARVCPANCRPKEHQDWLLC